MSKGNKPKRKVSYRYIVEVEKDDRTWEQKSLFDNLADAKKSKSYQEFHNRPGTNVRVRKIKGEEYYG